MKKIAVLYHKNCPDGFGAAWAAWKKFGSRADYIGVNHGEPLPRGLKGKEVYTLDFCYKGKNMDDLLEKAKRLVVLDHHVSQKDSIMRAHDYRYELDRSGAVISWNYFHPKKPLPRALKHIEDIDLWKFKMQYTREVSAILSTYPFEFKARDIFIKNFENAAQRKELIKAGAAILRYQSRVIEHLVGAATPITFAGYTIYSANSFVLTSEAGNILSKKYPPFALVWSEREGRIIVSLRSQKGFDVSKIAQKFGGGGHKNAAGFSFPAGKPFPWKRIKK
jgi:uncharacterized protein